MIKSYDAFAQEERPLGRLPNALALRYETPLTPVSFRIGIAAPLRNREVEDGPEGSMGSIGRIIPAIRHLRFSAGANDGSSADIFAGGISGRSFNLTGRSRPVREATLYQDLRCFGKDPFFSAEATSQRRMLCQRASGSRLTWRLAATAISRERKSSATDSSKPKRQIPIQRRAFRASVPREYARSERRLRHAGGVPFYFYKSGGGSGVGRHGACAVVSAHGQSELCRGALKVANWIANNDLCSTAISFGRSSISPIIHCLR